MDKDLIIKELINYYSGGNNGQFATKLGVKPQTISTWIARKSFDIELIFAKCEDISPEWLLTGQGDMLKSDRHEVKFVSEQKADKKLIPFYDDVATIGGCNSISASVDGCMPPSEWIDAGDWFHEAGAAIRHYGDSMVEYPSGCILALKKVEDLRLILWGRNYMVETTEFRITKRLQSGKDDTVVAYSSNTDTYPDGRQIHEPKVIPMESIRSVWLVLGCVVKEYSSGAVYIKK